MTGWLSTLSGPLLESLVSASLAGGAGIAAVWLLSRLTRSTPPRVRATLWWVACLELLTGLVLCLWIGPVELPVLPVQEPAPAASAPTASPVVPSTPRTAGVVGPASAVPGPPRTTRRTAAAPASAPGGAPFPWATAIFALWAAGVAGGLALGARELLRLRRTARRAMPVPGASPGGRLFTELVERLEVPGRPELRVTPEIGTPRATGLLRPMVLLPERALEAGDEELGMILAHELLHLRHRDLWLAWVPFLARRIFFFHPLAAFAEREHALAREAVCDAEVLRVLGAAPRTYGRLLLRWGVAPRETGLAAGGAAPSVHVLKRRLEMLHRTCRTTARRSPWWWLAAVVLAVGLVPVTLVGQDPPESPESLPAPPPASAPATPEPDLSAPPPPAEPPEELPPPEGGFSWVWSDDGKAFALLDPGSSFVLSGEGEGVKQLRAEDEPLLWFRRDGTEYVVRDGATIDRAREILAPRTDSGEVRTGAEAMQRAKEESSRNDAPRVPPALEELLDQAIADGTARRTE